MFFQWFIFIKIGILFGFLYLAYKLFKGGKQKLAGVITAIVVILFLVSPFKMSVETDRLTVRQDNVVQEYRKEIPKRVEADFDKDSAFKAHEERSDKATEDLQKTF